MRLLSGSLGVLLALLLGTSSAASRAPMPPTDTERYGRDLTERLDAVGEKLRDREGENAGRRWAQWYNWGNWANGWNNWRNW